MDFRIKLTLKNNNYPLVLVLVLMDNLIIKRLEAVYCRLGVSTVHGVGIFAIKNIPAGTNPFTDCYIGQDSILVDKKRIKNEQIKKLTEDYFPTNNNPECIVPMWPNQPIWTNYLNYTSDPEKVNMVLNNKGSWITTKNVSIGEELLENPKDLFNSNGTYKSTLLDKNNNEYLFLRK